MCTVDMDLFKYRLDRIVQFVNDCGILFLISIDAEKMYVIFRTSTTVA